MWHSAHDLCEALVALHDFAGAAALQQEAVRRLEIVRGPNHPETLLACFHLAESRRAMGDAGAALPLLRRAVDGFGKARAIGRGHLYTRSAALGLVDCLEELEMFEEADAFEEKFFGFE